MRLLQFSFKRTQNINTENNYPAHGGWSFLALCPSAPPGTSLILQMKKLKFREVNLLTTVTQQVKSQSSGLPGPGQRQWLTSTPQAPQTHSTSSGPFPEAPSSRGWGKSNHPRKAKIFQNGQEGSQQGFTPTLYFLKAQNTCCWPPFSRPWGSQPRSAVHQRCVQSLGSFLPPLILSNTPHHNFHCLHLTSPTITTRLDTESCNSGR